MLGLVIVKDDSWVEGFAPHDYGVPRATALYVFALPWARAARRPPDGGMPYPSGPARISRQANPS